MSLPSSSTNFNRLAAQWLGFGLIGLFLYAMLAAVVLLAAFILLQRDIAPEFPWLSSVQKHLYMKATRSIWQHQGSCVEFDEDLIYTPKNGTCRFDNVEFKTNLNFSADGRNTGAKPKGRGIAVLGDSHAMGWGVEDKQTFAAELQKLSRRPVFNLAVSSYGTVRELLRLKKSGLLGQVDTIIIQYCENDLEENLQGRTDNATNNKNKFETITHSESKLPSLLKLIKKAYVFSFSWPFKAARSRSEVKKPIDFQPHYAPLMAAIKAYPVLRDKRIMVFYSNGQGKRFRNYPSGTDQQFSNVEFVDVALQLNDYYRLDDHLTPEGHRTTAEQLWLVLSRPQPSQ